MAEPGPWRLLTAGLLGVVIALVAYTLYLTEAWAYLSNDPYACANCHRMDESVSSWNASSHQGIAVCNDCHAPHTPAVRQLSQGVNGIRHGWRFTFGTGSPPLRLHEQNSRVLEQNCVRCHSALLTGLTPDREPVIGSGCTRCHRSVGHA